MPYFVLDYDAAEHYTERRAPFRADHLAHVRAAHERGEIVMAGAIGDPPEGALLIFQAADTTPVEAFAAADPYVRNGVVTGWRVRPWHVVVGHQA